MKKGRVEYHTIPNNHHQSAEKKDHLKTPSEKDKSNPVRKVSLQGGDRPAQGGEMHVGKLHQRLQGKKDTGQIDYQL